MYFSMKEKWVLKVLEGYKSLSWMMLKTELRLLYTSSDERKCYRPKDLQCFVAKERKILKLSHLDEYQCTFLVITKNLEARNALLEYNQNDCFWSGLKPISFCTSLK